MKSKKRWILLVISCLVLIGIPGTVRLFRAKTEASLMFGRFDQALIQQDYPNAYQLTCEEFRSSLKYDDFVDQQRRLVAQFGSLRSAEQGQTEVGVGKQGWYGLIHARLNYDNQQVNMVFSLHREGREWKIFGYKQL